MTLAEKLNNLSKLSANCPSFIYIHGVVVVSPKELSGLDNFWFFRVKLQDGTHIDFITNTAVTSMKARETCLYGNHVVIVGEFAHVVSDDNKKMKILIIAKEFENLGRDEKYERTELPNWQDLNVIYEIDPYNYLIKDKWKGVVSPDE